MCTVLSEKWPTYINSTNEFLTFDINTKLRTYLCDPPTNYNSSAKPFLFLPLRFVDQWLLMPFIRKIRTAQYEQGMASTRGRHHCIISRACVAQRLQAWHDRGRIPDNMNNIQGLTCEISVECTARTNEPHQHHFYPRYDLRLTPYINHQVYYTTEGLIAPLAKEMARGLCTGSTREHDRFNRVCDVHATWHSIT